MKINVQPYPFPNQLELDQKETDALVNVVYPFMKQAPKEFGKAFVPLNLNGRNNVQEIDAFWELSRIMVEANFNAMPDSEEKQNLLKQRDISRKAAAEIEAHVNQSAKVMRVFAEYEKEQMIILAESILLTIENAQ